MIAHGQVPGLVQLLVAGREGAGGERSPTEAAEVVVGQFPLAEAAETAIDLGNTNTVKGFRIHTTVKNFISELILS